jgi:hypothetical protein
MFLLLFLLISLIWMVPMYFWVTQRVPSAVDEAQMNALLFVPEASQWVSQRAGYLQFYRCKLLCRQPLAPHQPVLLGTHLPCIPPGAEERDNDEVFWTPDRAYATGEYVRLGWDEIVGTE